MSVRPRADRLLWLDIAKGIGILLVVVAHVWRGLEGSGILRESAPLTVIDNAVYSFHMPLFFFLAGLTLPHSLTAGLREFLAAKIKRIAYPFVLWSFMVGGVMLVIGSKANTPLHPQDVLLSPFRPIQQFWFLQALFVLQIAALVIANVRFMFAVSIVTCLAAAAFVPYGGVLFALLHFFIFLAAGALLGSRIGALGGMVTALATAGFIGFTWIAIASGQYYMSLVYLPAAACGIALTLGVSQLLAGMAAGRGLARLGAMSLTIYVAHIVAASGFRVALQRVGVPPDPAVYLCLCTIAGISLPVVMHIVLERLNLLWLFGLGKRCRPALEPLLHPTD